MIVLSPICIFSGTYLLMQAWRPAVNIEDEFIRPSAYVFIDADDLFSPCAVETKFGKAQTYYCIIRSNGKYAIIRFSSRDFEKLNLDTLNKTLGQMMHFSTKKVFKGPQAEIPSDLKEIVISYYIQYISPELSDESFADVFHAYIIDYGSTAQIYDGLTNLAFGIIALLMSVTFLKKIIKNRKLSAVTANETPNKRKQT